MNAKKDLQSLRESEEYRKKCQALEQELIENGWNDIPIPPETLAWFEEIGAEKAEAPFEYVVGASTDYAMFYPKGHLINTPLDVLRTKLKKHFDFFGVEVEGVNFKMEK